MISGLLDGFSGRRREGAEWGCDAMRCDTMDAMYSPDDDYYLLLRNHPDATTCYCWLTTG